MPQSAAVGSPPRALIRRPSFSACLGAITAPELYRNFAIHLFVMFPAAVVMCWIGTQVDAALHLDPILAGWPARVLGVSLIGAGGFWVWYVYGYLYLSGGGSPGTHVDGGPTALVDTGPYTAFRHPSVLGKLAGVIGLGIAFQSNVFLIAFVPVLVLYSVVTNRYLQERFCDARFGHRYQVYRERVPMLIPRWSGIMRWARDEAAVPDELPREDNLPQPEGIWMEFRGYLIGLGLLIALFAGVWLAARQLGG
jgi:protein-S-isoprenylcysteine O-methyltransferase Ste14